MLTFKSSKWMGIFAAVLMMVLLPGISLAQRGDEAPVVGEATGMAVSATANDYISALDNLRAMSQVETRQVLVKRAREVAVFDHSGYLAQLQNQAMLISNRPYVASANDFVTELEQLRTVGQGQSPRPGTGEFITTLDQLRQLGQDAARDASANRKI